MSIQQEKFEEIADKIREKIDSTEPIKPNDFAHKINDVYNKGFTDGKKAEYDAFWDELQNYGKPTGYRYAFSSGVFTDKNYNPKYTIKISGAVAVNSQDIFVNSPITDTKVAIDAADCTGTTRMFSGSKIVTIRKLIVSEKPAYSNTFYEANYLQNITIEGAIGNNINFGACPLLKDSIISVINALSATKSGLTVTFKTAAVNEAFGINVDDVKTYPEGSEFYNLRNSKSNWTFSYA